MDGTEGYFYYCILSLFYYKENYKQINNKN